jgi:hypothetical protein
VDIVDNTAQHIHELHTLNIAVGIPEQRLQQFVLWHLLAFAKYMSYMRTKGTTKQLSHG